MPDTFTTATPEQMIAYMESHPLTHRKVYYKHGIMEFLRNGKVCHRQYTTAKPTIKNGRVFVRRRGELQELTATHVALASGKSLVTCWKVI